MRPAGHSLKVTMLAETPHNVIPAPHPEIIKKEGAERRSYPRTSGVPSDIEHQHFTLPRRDYLHELLTFAFLYLSVD